MILKLLFKKLINENKLNGISYLLIKICININHVFLGMK